MPQYNSKEINMNEKKTTSYEKTFHEIYDLMKEERRKLGKRDDTWNPCGHSAGTVSLGDGNWMSVPKFRDWLKQKEDRRKVRWKPPVFYR